MRSPKVSVIIPVYNRAEYLAGAIQSVLSQNYPNLEVIVVDSASRDETAEVVSHFDDARIRLIVQEGNTASTPARSTGLRPSSGDSISLLNADDTFHQEKIRVEVAFLQKYPDVGVTYNGHFETDSSGTLLDFWRSPTL